MSWHKFYTFTQSHYFRGVGSNFGLGDEELDCTDSTPTNLVNFTECIVCR